ncbi:MAG: sugar O-acetyltransferase [Acidimicrobiia bacterium]|nr:sugar O-acetyltransferase [Acidimicrobiia bacterium]
MIAGELYVADDPELKAMALRARRLEKQFNQSPARTILEKLLGEIGERSEIRPPFHCDYGSHIRIGARVFANCGLIALDVASITIGDDVQIGPHVQLLTPTHPLDAELRRAKWEAAKPIVIDQNAWLGGGAIVLPGVTVGENAIVGAGAIVTKDVPPDVVVAGNPARVIRPL